MKVRIAMLCLAAIVGLGAFGISMTSADDEAAVDSPKPVMEDLMTSPLAGIEGREVIISRVTLPPNTTLPKHWHPGEEFAYVLEGSVTLWQEGKEDIVAKKGDVVTVPLKHVHTAITGDEGATALIFRVHEEGQPGRTLVK